VRKICIDDFATKKRYTYGTVMINIETGRIVDMIETRECKEVADWLKTFPNIEVVSRDGSPLYAKAIKDAHPQALQVNDRFHLLKGLTEAVRLCINSFLPTRVVIPSDKAPADYWQRAPRKDADLPQRLHDATTKKRTATVNRVRELAAQGLTIQQIRKLTGHAYSTVKKYIDPDFTPEWKEYGVNYPSKLKPYCDRIDELIVLRKTFREIREAIMEMGYRGSESAIRMYATRKRRHNQLRMSEYTQNTEIIERKYIMRLLYNPMEKTSGITEEQLNKVIELNPQLLTIYGLVNDFRSLVASKDADALESWMQSARAIESPDIESYINGLSRDIVAVKNAIMYSYNNGPAEGNINKIKRIKHSMYGRASFSTLRTKVLMFELWKNIN